MEKIRKPFNHLILTEGTCMPDPMRLTVCFSPRKRCDLLGLPLRKKYRSHFEVIASILESTQYRGATSTSIMKLVNTNHKQITKYLESLVQTGFIEVGFENSKVMYRSGKKGFEFLRHYYALQEMLLVEASRKLDDTIEANSRISLDKHQHIKLLYQRP